MQGTTPLKLLTLPEKVAAEKHLRTFLRPRWRKKCAVTIQLIPAQVQLSPFAKGDSGGFDSVGSSVSLVAPVKSPLSPLCKGGNPIATQGAE
jgi:hypothetical protein